MKLLLIEDEEAIAVSILNYLKSEGYICETVPNYIKASEKISVYEYDIVLVDLTLPDGSGLDLIRELKMEKKNTGIIIISAKNSLDEKILGLELGADDYITKPFHLAELNARIKSVIRRRKFEGNNETRFNEIFINHNDATVWVNNKQLKLTKKEYDLLIFFISNKNRVMTKEAIAEHLWQDNIDLSDSLYFVYTHIKNLRKKILEKGGNDYIKTVYSVGYKFVDL
ncbi:MAG: response regulator transcription factor [Rhodothermaceae bacterium]